MLLQIEKKMDGVIALLALYVLGVLMLLWVKINNWWTRRQKKDEAAKAATAGEQA